MRSSDPLGENAPISSRGSRARLWRPPRAVAWLLTVAAANAEGTVYGTLLIGVLLAAEDAGREGYPETIGVLVLYWLASLYTHTLGLRLSRRERLNVKLICRSCVHELPIIEGALIPVLALLVAWAAGATVASAVTAALWAAAGSIVTFEVVAGWLTRLRPHDLWLQGGAGAVQGVGDHRVEGLAALTAGEPRSSAPIPTVATSPLTGGRPPLGRAGSRAVTRPRRTASTRPRRPACRGASARSRCPVRRPSHSAGRRSPRAQVGHRRGDHVGGRVADPVGGERRRRVDVQLEEHGDEDRGQDRLLGDRAAEDQVDDRDNENEQDQQPDRADVHVLEQMADPDRGQRRNVAVDEVGQKTGR
jgi:hypothetical protein